MNAPTLPDQIAKLSEALRRTRSVDAQTRDALVALQHEIETFLQAQGDSSLAERLEKLAVQFEADHPAVGSALRQTIDALVKAGI
jgi:hypothetical protein